MSKMALEQYVAEQGQGWNDISGDGRGQKMRKDVARDQQMVTNGKLFQEWLKNTDR